MAGKDKAKLSGSPEPHPSGAVVICSVWQYTIKHDGHNKARTCCDGSILRTKSLNYAEQ
jgi:hypothetical protein